MSVIEGKKVCLVDLAPPTLQTLKEKLEHDQAVVSCTSCQELAAHELLPEVDLLIVNYQSESESCTKLLHSLQNSTKLKYMPVITQVASVDAKISRALMLGAADYFTATEDINSVLQKVKNNFGLPNTFDGVATVDITEPDLTAATSSVRIFSVEDDPLLRALLSTKFEMSGVTYDFSADGINVEAKIRAFKPSVILLDIMIGAINGLDILEAIKKVPELSEIPVVVFSNQDSHEERERAAKLKAADYLVKATTDLSDLVKILTKLSS